MIAPFFIGKDRGLFSKEKPYDQVNSNTFSIGVLYYPGLTRISVNGFKQPVIGYDVYAPAVKPKKVRAVYEPKRVEPHISRWQSCRARSLKKNLECTITSDFVKNIMEGPCVYCGDSSKASELDRKDSSKGYTEDNVAPACRRCNTIKNNVVSYEEMLKIVEVLGWRQ